MKKVLVAFIGFKILIGTGLVFGLPSKSSAKADFAVSSLDSLVLMLHARANEPELVLDTIIDSEYMLYEELPDSVYIQRLASIESPIFFPFNSKIRSFIRLYTQRRRDQMERMMGLAEYYFPMFEAALDARGLPLELKHLAVIESALNPRALSRAGASGIWQFMYATGKKYGLEVNSFIDERRDPYEATRAAVSYLADLYAIYGDWHLAIAAYNCGPGNLNRAIRRSGGKRDFWQIYHFLPRETRSYIPAFIAATYAFTFAREHNLNPVPSQLPILTDTIMVSKPLHFTQVSEKLDIPVELIRELNPQFRRDVIPATNRMFALRLPFDQTTAFASIEAEIFAHRREEFFPDNQMVVYPSGHVHDQVPPAGRAAVHYTVKSGDALGLIAEWFNVRASDIRFWNNISGNLIRVGQRLVIYVPRERASHYQAVAARHMGQEAPARAGGAADQVAVAAGDAGEEGYIWHTVRAGDNIWSIARQYPGVTNEEILRLNNITDPRRIQPGQRLRIKPRS